MYKKVELELSGPQLRKLSVGKVVQLSPSQLASNKHKVMLHPLMAKKIMHSQKMKKGCRICMSPEELQLSGSGLSDIWHFIKSIAPMVKEKASKFYEVAKPIVQDIIKSDTYQKYIRPKARELVDTTLDRLPYSDTTIPVSHLVGDYTNAFGVKKARKPRAKTAKPKAKKSDISGGSFKLRN